MNFFFHLMPYPHLSQDFEDRCEGAWIDIPNAFYDPQKDHELYHSRLDDLLLVEAVRGFLAG